MAPVSVRLRLGGAKEVEQRLATLLAHIENPLPVVDKAAQYMVRATKNRLARTNLSPNGRPFAALKPSTLKWRRQIGADNGKILYARKELYDSIGEGYVNKKGFSIEAEAEHASFHQKGFKRGRTKVPARPFLGFSTENKRRIARMVLDYIYEGKL